MDCPSPTDAARGRGAPGPRTPGTPDAVIAAMVAAHSRPRLPLRAVDHPGEHRADVLALALADRPRRGAAGQLVRDHQRAAQRAQTPSRVRGPRHTWPARGRAARGTAQPARGPTRAAAAPPRAPGAAASLTEPWPCLARRRVRNSRTCGGTSTRPPVRRRFRRPAPRFGPDRCRPPSIAASRPERQGRSQGSPGCRSPRTRLLPSRWRPRRRCAQTRRGARPQPNSASSLRRSGSLSVPANGEFWRRSRSRSPSSPMIRRISLTGRSRVASQRAA